MAFVHGKSINIQLGGTDVSAYCTSVKFPQEVATAKTTTFTATSDTYIAGIKNATMSISGKWDPTADGVIQPMVGTIVTFIFGPQGSTTGSVKYTGSVLIQTYDTDTGADKENTFDIKGQVTGAITRTTY